MSYVVPVLFFTLISGLAGVVLTVAGRLFRVEVDDTVEKLTEALPGINCGACGFASCAKYAAAIKDGKIAPNQCKPGGADAVNKLSEVLGKKIEAAEPEAAFSHCAGACTIKYDYQGTESCRASELYYNGREECRFGCTGLGDCVRICPTGAITIGKHGRAVIAHNKCNACGLCVKACPKKIIRIQKVSRAVHVTCCSKDSGKATRKVCANGCIGCKLCEKKCPTQAIKVRDNLARINYDLCNSCGECASVCPSKCITLRRECDILLN
ncbi:MAG: RnfABCDGE type electron transport complex subunit B [Oscillospiraceae bacterium]|nr:RnfABCDGE type electron transport complex subunit B [Oscillospiraceae bacterium]